MRYFFLQVLKLHGLILSPRDYKSLKDCKPHRGYPKGTIKACPTGTAKARKILKPASMGSASCWRWSASPQAAPFSQFIGSTRRVRRGIHGVTSVDFLVAGLIGFLLSGCGDYVIDNPIDHFNVESLVDRGPSLSEGTRKKDVLKKWGYPDRVKLAGETPVWGAPIQHWIYYAWIPDFPISYRYIAKEYRLVFQGDILIKIQDPKSVRLEKIAEGLKMKNEESKTDKTILTDENK